MRRAGGTFRCAIALRRHMSPAIAIRIADRPHPGRPSRLTAEQKAGVAQWVRQGPKPSEDGVVRWRLVDLAQEIERCPVG